MVFCFSSQARSDTLYCYDFLELLEAGVREQWVAYAKDRPQVSKEDKRKKERRTIPRQTVATFRLTPSFLLDVQREG